LFNEDSVIELAARKFLDRDLLQSIQQNNKQKIFFPIIFILTVFMNCMVYPTINTKQFILFYFIAFANIASPWCMLSHVRFCDLSGLMEVVQSFSLWL